MNFFIVFGLDNYYLGEASYAYWREGGPKVLEGDLTTKIKYITSKKIFRPRGPEPPPGSVPEEKWDKLYSIDTLSLLVEEVEKESLHVTPYLFLSLDLLSHQN